MLSRYVGRKCDRSYVIETEGTAENGLPIDGEGIRSTIMEILYMEKAEEHA